MSKSVTKTRHHEEVISVSSILKELRRIRKELAIVLPTLSDSKIKQDAQTLIKIISQAINKYEGKCKLSDEEYDRLLGLYTYVVLASGFIFLNKEL